MTKATKVVKETIKFETDQEVMDRIAKRFDILHDMTKAAIKNDVRAMIVTGPPGVGKSYGVEQELEKASMFEYSFWSCFSYFDGIFTITTEQYITCATIKTTSAILK